MNARKLIATVLWSILAAAAFSLPAADRQPQDWDQLVDDVQISLYLESEKPTPSGLPAVDLAVRNLGSVSKKISLGGSCGPVTPGWKTNGVVLIITDLQGRPQTLEDIPGPPLSDGCFGGLGIFAVDVKPGETTSVSLDLDCYYATVWNNRALHYVADWDLRASALKYAWARGGTYSLRAELGKLKSNDLRVLFSKDVPSRRCFESGLVVRCSNSK